MKRGQIQIYIESGAKAYCIRIIRISGIMILFLITELSPENHKMFSGVYVTEIDASQVMRALYQGYIPRQV